MFIVVSPIIVIRRTFTAYILGGKMAKIRNSKNTTILERIQYSLLKGHRVALDPKKKVWRSTFKHLDHLLAAARERGLDLSDVPQLKV